MTKAYDRIEEGLKEALSIAKGDQPAASITVNGHVYVPKVELDALVHDVERHIEICSDLMEDNKRMREALEYMRDYPKEGMPRRTKDGYPSEFVYDEYAYRRMVDSFREACRRALGEESADDS